MSSLDEGTISFPVGMLKAETVRAIAKDLNVPAGGKKEEVIERMRTSSTSGWTSTTPTKRKMDDNESSRPSTGSKRRARKSTGSNLNDKSGPVVSSGLEESQAGNGTAAESPGKRQTRQSAAASMNAAPASSGRKQPRVRTLVSPGSPSKQRQTRRSTGSNLNAALPASPGLQQEEAARVAEPNHVESVVDGNPVADEQLTSVQAKPGMNEQQSVDGRPPVDADPPIDVEPDVDDKVAPDAKSTADDDAVVGMLDSASPKKATFDDYLITGTTTAFLKAGELENLILPDFDRYRGVSSLWKAAASFANTAADLERRLHLWLVPTVDGEIQNVGAFQATYKEVLPKQGEKAWYEVTISRNETVGALNVKFLKGAKKDKGVVPLDPSDPESGTFWVSNPRLASAQDSDVLGEINDSNF